MGGTGGGGNGDRNASRGSIDDLLDAPSPPPPPRARPTAPPAEAPRPERPPVQLRVVWSDLCRIPADVHTVGHYQGVMPTSAEGALDAAISGTDSSRRIIAEHTRRQWFLGDFGHVNYFPSSDQDNIVQLGAVAGMGRPGTFTEARCARLAENLLVELCALGTAKRVATVGIGSGAGNLSFDQTARAMTSGFAAALQSSRMRSPCTHIDIIEYDRLRAERFLAAFKTAMAGKEALLVLADELELGENGGVSFASASVYALERMARGAAAADGSTDGLRQALERMGEPCLPPLVMDRLKDADPDALVRSADVTLEVRRDDNDRPPVRISVLDDGNGRSIRVAAITGTATVPERHIDADPKLIDEIVRRMSPPTDDDLDWLPELMSRMVLPSDLQALVSADSPLVFEVDRRTAQIHWELVVDLVRSSSSAADAPDQPLVLQTSVSRQLRTTYSRVPALDVQTASKLNVLVIGDPGGQNFSLPGAREEAEAVYRALTGLGISVTALIGAPHKGGTPPSNPGSPPAKSPSTPEAAAEAPIVSTPAGRLDVLRELLSGRYQIVHYCGHGTFDPDDQRRAGWLFEGGLLTSRELSQLGTPPRLVVANACFTSRLGGTGTGSGTGTGTASQPAQTGTGTGTGSGTGIAALSAAGGSGGGSGAGGGTGDEAQLTPSLADEFFKSGVANYVGAAWKVSDTDAVVFSTTFYETLLGPDRATLGDALTAARTAVWNSHSDSREGRGTTWAAYQHYGDPTDQLLVNEKGDRDGS